MWRQFLRENARYIIALSLALGVMLACLYGFMGARAVNTARTHNAARADSLNTAIAALPAVTSIAPAQTSGLTEYVLTTRSTLADQIAERYVPRYAPWLYVIIPTYYAVRTQQSTHANVTEDAARTLRRTIDDLTHLKKIIEYMPLVDLGGAFAEDTGLTERLGRTKKGIDQAIAYLQLSGFKHEWEIVNRLTRLNAQTLNLTDQTKGAWAAELLELQKLIIADIKDRDVQQSDLMTKLQNVSTSYQ